jgi:hypothetical protein
MTSTSSIDAKRNRTNLNAELYSRVCAGPDLQPLAQHSLGGVAIVIITAYIYVRTFVRFFYFLTISWFG